MIMDVCVCVCVCGGGGVSSLQTGNGFKYLSSKWFMPGKGLVFFKMKKTEIN